MEDLDDQAIMTEVEDLSRIEIDESLKYGKSNTGMDISDTN